MAETAVNAGWWHAAALAAEGATEDEREAVVRWLRGQEFDTAWSRLDGEAAVKVLAEAARRIEAGEHR